MNDIILVRVGEIFLKGKNRGTFFRQLVRPDRRSMFDVLLSRIDRGLAGVVRGQLVICLVNGVLSGIGFYIAGLDYWPLLTLIATVLSIIPIFGAIISSIPAVVVGLQDGFGVALFVLAWIIGIHQVEANLLNPKILGDAATKPLVVRLDGNKVEEGRAILAGADNPLVTLADNMDSGADKAAELASTTPAG